MDFEELFLNQNTEKEKKELPIFTEYAIDFDTLEPLKNGDRLVELNGNEALKVWIFKALKTKRNSYKIHSDSYGNDLDIHIGTVYQESIKNALIISENHFVKMKIPGEVNGPHFTIEVTLLRIPFIPMRKALAEPNFKNISSRMGMWLVSSVTKKRTISLYWPLLSSK